MSWPPDVHVVLKGTCCFRRRKLEAAGDFDDAEEVGRSLLSGALRRIVQGQSHIKGEPHQRSSACTLKLRGPSGIPLASQNPTTPRGGAGVAYPIMCFGREGAGVT